MINAEKFKEMLKAEQEKRAAEKARIDAEEKAEREAARLAMEELRKWHLRTLAKQKLDGGYDLVANLDCDTNNRHTLNYWATGFNVEAGNVNTHLLSITAKGNKYSLQDKIDSSQGGEELTLEAVTTRTCEILSRLSCKEIFGNRKR